jgi:hypothetical protein
MCATMTLPHKIWLKLLLDSVSVLPVNGGSKTVRYVRGSVFENTYTSFTLCTLVYDEWNFEQSVFESQS